MIIERTGKGWTSQSESSDLTFLVLNPPPSHSCTARPVPRTHVAECRAVSIAAAQPHAAARLPSLSRLGYFPPAHLAQTDIHPAPRSRNQSGDSPRHRRQELSQPRSPTGCANGRRSPSNRTLCELLKPVL